MSLNYVPRLNIFRVPGNGRYGWFVLMAFVVFLCFLPAVLNGFVHWDDNLFVYENPNIKIWTPEFWQWVIHPFQGNWTPLALLSHGIDYALYGFNPAGHHLTSILFHTCNTFLVALVFMKLILAAGSRQPLVGEKDLKFAVIAASCGALFFGISPLRVESVVWISERRDVMFLFFGLLSIYSYLLYCSPRQPNQLLLHKKHYYRRSLFYFACGLMSKSMLVTLPVVLLIFDFYPIQRFSLTSPFRDKWLLIKEKIPFFLLSAIVSLVTLFFQKKTGAMFSVEDIPLIARIGSASYVAIFYLSKSLLPMDLAPLYTIENMQSALPVHHLAAFGIVILLTGVLIYLAKFSKIYLIIWIYYLLTILPISGLFQTGHQFAADRYTYFPGLALAFLGGIVCARIGISSCRQAGYARLSRNVFIALMACYILVNIVLLQQQIRIWHNSIALWSRQIHLYPEGASNTPYINRGGAYFDAGKYLPAIYDFTRAAEIDPSDSNAFANRGLAYLKNKEYKKAVKDLVVAARLGNEGARKFLLKNKIWWRNGAGPTESGPPHSDRTGQ
ncbi:tetratricopeptide repeat protein [Thermodesulfobacteriota bacterium]